MYACLLPPEFKVQNN